MIDLVDSRFWISLLWAMMIVFFVLWGDDIGYWIERELGVVRCIIVLAALIVVFVMLVMGCQNNRP